MRSSSCAAFPARFNDVVMCSSSPRPHWSPPGMLAAWVPSPGLAVWAGRGRALKSPSQRCGVGLAGHRAHLSAERFPSDSGGRIGGSPPCSREAGGAALRCHMGLASFCLGTFSRSLTAVLSLPSCFTSASAPSPALPPRLPPLTLPASQTPSFTSRGRKSRGSTIVLSHAGVFATSF